MNQWKCDHPGCKMTASGIGSAWGLIALGWFFNPEVTEGLFKVDRNILCPHHHPDGFPAALRQAQAFGASIKISQQLIHGNKTK